MKRFYHLIFLFVTLKSFSQAQGNPVYGTADSIYSKVLKEQRKIVIYNPGAKSNDRVSGKKTYPVIYLFDGDAHFYE